MDSNVKDTKKAGGSGFDKKRDLKSKHKGAHAEGKTQKKDSFKKGGERDASKNGSDKTFKKAPRKDKPSEGDAPKQKYDPKAPVLNRRQK